MRSGNAKKPKIAAARSSNPAPLQKTIDLSSKLQLLSTDNRRTKVTVCLAEGFQLTEEATNKRSTRSGHVAINLCKRTVAAMSNCEKDKATLGDVDAMFVPNRTITRWFATLMGTVCNQTNCSSKPTKCGQGHLGVSTHPSNPTRQVILFQRKKQAIEHWKLLLHPKHTGKKEIVSLFLSGSDKAILSKSGDHSMTPICTLHQNGKC